MARWLAAAGADVRAVVGTTPETADEARQTLRQRYGIDCRAFASVEAALEAESPDIVAICTPFIHHREHLRLASQAKAHCLCEKPMWWDDGEGALPRAEETARIADAFAAAGRHLALITQWPQTLRFYYELHPDLRGQPVRRFDMMLAPSRPGLRMILDAAPHIISMLQALNGPGDVRHVRRRFLDARQRELELKFDHVHARGRTEARLALSACESPPRPAAYAIDGRRADRRIRTPEYTMELEAGGRRIIIEDPLKLHVEEFLRQVERGALPDRRALVEGISSLETLYSSEEEEETC